MGQMENSLLSIKNIFFLLVGNCVICYNNHGFIPMVSVIACLGKEGVTETSFFYTLMTV